MKESCHSKFRTRYDCKCTFGGKLLHRHQLHHFPSLFTPSPWLLARDFVIGPTNTEYESMFRVTHTIPCLVLMMVGDFIHTYTHIHIHIHTYTHMHIHTHTHAYTYTYTHTHTHMHIHTHIRTLTYTYTYTYTYTHIHTHTHTCTRIHIHMRTHTYSYTHAHTYTHTYTYTHTHTYTHTYTQCIHTRTSVMLITLHLYHGRNVIGHFLYLANPIFHSPHQAIFYIVCMVFELELPMLKGVDDVGLRTTSFSALSMSAASSASCER